MNLLQMTLSGGVFVLLIVVVRALALHRLPKGVFLALWEMAALRLLLPFAIPVSLRVCAAPDRQMAVRAPWAVGGASAPVSGEDVSEAMAAASGLSSGTVLTVLWLAGVALMAAYFGMAYVRARRRFRASGPDDTPAVRQWLAGQRLCRALRVQQSALVSSPLTYGILRPVILLPADMTRSDETALTYMLTHELVHIRRFDGVAKMVFAAVLCIHWFNPLAWVLYILANRDLELSCDERVLHTLGGGVKASYALTLISMEEARSKCLSMYNHFSKLAIEERIEAIMKYRKASVMAATLAIVLVVGMTTAFAVSVQTGSTPFANGQSIPMNVERCTADSTLMSYVNPSDGRTYYSWDGGKTFQPMTDEEFQQRFPRPNVTWWTAEEYAAWLENEKTELQAMLGEKGWIGGRGEFVWTQEIIDETIAMYEHILQEIRAGKLYSKSVNGDTDVMLASGADSSVFVKENGKMVKIDPSGVQVATMVRPNDGTFATSGGTMTVEKIGESTLNDWDVVRSTERTEEEWRQIIADIESGKIPPYEVPDDPNIDVGFVAVPGGRCMAGN